MLLLFIFITSKTFTSSSLLKKHLLPQPFSSLELSFHRFKLLPRVPQRNVPEVKGAQQQGDQLAVQHRIEEFTLGKQAQQALEIAFREAKRSTATGDAAYKLFQSGLLLIVQLKSS